VALIAILTDLWMFHMKKPLASKPKRPPTFLFVTNVNASLISVSVLFARSHLQGQTLPPTSTWFEFHSYFRLLHSFNSLCKLESQGMFVCLLANLSGLSPSSFKRQIPRARRPSSQYFANLKKMKTIPPKYFYLFEPVPELLDLMELKFKSK